MLLPPDEYLKTVRRPYPVLFMSMILEGLSQEECFQGVVDVPFAIQNFVRNEFIWYYSRSEIATLGTLAFRYWNDPERLVTIQEVFLQREQALLHAAGGELEGFRLAFNRYMPILISVFSVEGLLDQELTKLLDVAFTQAEARNIKRLLVTPEKDNYFKAQEYDLVTTRDLTTHVRKYEWLHSRYGSENPLTLEDVRDQLARIDVPVYLKRYHDEKAAVRAALDTVRSKLPDYAYFVDLLQFLMYYRTQRTDVINRALYYSVPRFKRLATQRGIQYDDLLYCTISEVVSAIPAASEIAARRRSEVFLLSEGNMQLLSGTDTERVATHLAELPPDSDYVHGDVACEGAATGPVRIVLNPSDYRKVNGGDILVTSMTTPDMFPIMKLASAFLTDEGGVTCHAAIVARELGKPCIIGTRFATKVFRDDDYVKFDTISGNVTRVPTPEADTPRKIAIWIIDDVSQVRHEIEAALMKVLDSQRYVVNSRFNNLDEPVAEIKRILRDRARWEELPSVIITDLFLETGWRDGLDVLRKINRSLTKFREITEQLKARKISVFVFSYFRRFLVEQYAGDLAVQADYAQTIGKLDLMSIPPDHVIDKEKPEFVGGGSEATDLFKDAVNGLALKVKDHLEPPPCF